MIGPNGGGQISLILLASNGCFVSSSDLRHRRIFARFQND